MEILWKVIGVMIENIKVIKWPIFFGSLLLLIANEQILNWLGLNQFKDDYQSWIGSAFLFSSVFICLEIMKVTYAFIKGNVKRYQYLKEEHEQFYREFEMLNKTQHIIIYVLYTDASKPCHTFDNGLRRSWTNDLDTHLIDLKSKRLIRSQQNVSFVSCYQLTDKAKEMIDTHPELFLRFEESVESEL